MSTLDQRPAADTWRPVAITSAIVIAESAEVRSRIAAALAEQGLEPLEELDSPAAVATLDTDASSIVIFFCKVDVPQEVTSLRRLCREADEPAIVVISPPTTGAGVRRTLDAGADALVFDSELELTLAATIRAVASGQSVVPRKVRASVERPTLSHREFQVLALVHEGLTNAEIAERLYLAESTIKSHLASIFTKLGVHSRMEASAVFVDLELATVATASVGLPHPSEQTTA